MPIAEGPETLTCSARRCEKAAAWAIVWSNPAIHYGRSKTWLACDEHREFLHDYLAYRNFPAKAVPLEEFLASESKPDTL